MGGASVMWYETTEAATDEEMRMCIFGCVIVR